MGGKRFDIEFFWKDNSRYFTVEPYFFLHLTVLCHCKFNKFWVFDLTYKLPNFYQSVCPAVCRSVFFETTTGGRQSHTCSNTTHWSFKCALDSELMLVQIIPTLHAGVRKRTIRH